MKINVLKKTGKELKIELQGADHGLCNLLQKRLLEERSVDMGGYDIPHPLASNPIIYIRTKGSAKPDEVLMKAVEKSRDENEAFSKEFDKALKSWSSS